MEKRGERGEVRREKRTVIVIVIRQERVVTVIVRSLERRAVTEIVISQERGVTERSQEKCQKVITESPAPLPTLEKSSERREEKKGLK